MSAATTRNAPTAAGQPPSTSPVAARSAAPGVDHAAVIGIRYRHASTTHASPIVTQSARSPLAACAGVAPTARRPVSTTTKELVNPTSAVTIPAVIGRASDVDVAGSVIGCLGLGGSRGMSTVAHAS